MPLGEEHSHCRIQRERGANTLTFPRHLPPSLSFSGLIKSEAKDQMGLGDTVLRGQPLSHTLEGSGAQRQAEGRWGGELREMHSQSAAGGSRPPLSAAPHPTSPLLTREALAGGRIGELPLQDSH